MLLKIPTKQSIIKIKISKQSFDNVIKKQCLDSIEFSFASLWPCISIMLRSGSNTPKFNLFYSRRLDSSDASFLTVIPLVAV